MVSLQDLRTTIYVTNSLVIFGHDKYVLNIRSKDEHVQSLIVGVALCETSLPSNDNHINTIVFDVITTRK